MCACQVKSRGSELCASSYHRLPASHTFGCRLARAVRAAGAACQLRPTDDTADAPPCSDDRSATGRDRMLVLLAFTPCIRRLLVPRQPDRVRWAVAAIPRSPLRQRDPSRQQAACQLRRRRTGRCYGAHPPARSGCKKNATANQQTNRGSRDESQRIAAWKLLYRVRHPGPCVSRLQTIPHSDVGSSRDLDPKETGSLLCRGPQLIKTPESPRTSLPAVSATALQPECRAKPPQAETCNGIE